MKLGCKALYILISGIVFFVLLIPANLNLIALQDPSQEEVTVIAVEVPVRVLKNGTAVKGLTQDAFEVYENGRKQEITSFEAVSRKIIPDKKTPSELKGSPEPRLFILIFNIFDYNKHVGEGIDHFFNNIFQSGDRVMVVAEDLMLNIQRGSTISQMAQDLKDTLKKQKSISTGATVKAFQDMNYEAGRLITELRVPNPRTNWYVSVRQFYDRYVRIWTEYKRRYIIPDEAFYKSIIRRVRGIDGEKWALCFQQREMFPRLKRNSSLEREINELVETPTNDPVVSSQQRGVKVKQSDVQRVLNFSNDMPVDALKELFMQANITFHLMLLKSTKPYLYRDFELREVAQDYENAFREISNATGGEVIFNNQVVEALKEAGEVEDNYYMLVYSPKNTQANQKRRIEVKVNTQGADIIYLKQLPKFEAPPIYIADFKAGRKNIEFLLKNYKRTKLKDKTAGIADIRITIFDKNSEKVFDEGRTLELVKKDTQISLNFGQLQSGQYFIIIQAVDKVANETDVYSGNIRL